MESRQVELAKRLLESKGYNVSKKLSESKYVAYYVKNDRGYGGRTELKTFNSESEADSYCNSFNQNGGYEDEEGNKFYVDYELVESKKPLARAVKESINKLHESSNDDKFKVGDVIRFSMLYGGSVTAEVVDRSDDKLTLREKWVAEDTLEDTSDDTTYDIHTDDNGVEYIITWEYYDHKGVAYPPNHKSKY